MTRSPSNCGESPRATDVHVPPTLRPLLAVLQDQVYDVRMIVFPFRPDAAADPLDGQA